MTHRHQHPPWQQHRPRGASRRLALVLGLTLLYTAAEVIGGIASNSLALLADAGHMMTDNLALGLALLGAYFSTRPPDPGRTYGYQRAEILTALTNGVALVVVCVFVFWEAIHRLEAPPAIRADLMAVVAAGGLLVNLVGAWILRGGRLLGLNVHAAFLHVLGDLLGSAGALLAALCIKLFGWTWADPLASLAIGLIIVFSSIRLVLDSVNVLMEGAPIHLDTQEVRECLAAVDGVGSVHDLHIWSLGGGTPLLSAHLVVDHTVSAPKVLRSATRVLAERFGIVHSTLQVEPSDFNIVQGLVDEPSPLGTDAPEAESPHRR